MKRKIISLILAMFMLTGLFASCGGDKDGDDTDAQTGGKVSVTETESDPEIDKVESYVDNLAAGVSFDGEKFNFIGKDDGSNFPTADEETGNLESDAIYFRNRAVNEKFGVTIENIKTLDGADTADKVRIDVSAGSMAYDLAFGSILTVGQPLLRNDSLSRSQDFSQIDLSQEWWISSLEDDYSIGESLYILSGPIITNHYSNAACILFNKQVAEDFDVENLYEVVKSGGWTIDKMFEAASVIPSGSNIYRYGVSRHETGVAFLFGAGERITIFDENHLPTVATTLSSSISDIADKISVQLGDLTISRNTEHEDEDEDLGVLEIRDVFAKDEILFLYDQTDAPTSLREKDVSFGILPFPKLDENQSEYITYASAWSGAGVFIPKVVRNPELTGTIVEAMAALSKEYIEPKFYDIRLQGRSVYDTESREMLDIIYSTMTYDMCDLYSGGDMNQWGAFLTNLTNSVVTDTETLASSYAANARTLQNNIKLLLKKISY